MALGHTLPLCAQHFRTVIAIVFEGATPFRTQRITKILHRSGVLRLRGRPGVSLL